VRAIHDHSSSLQRDHPPLQHPIEFRKQCFDLLFRVHALDNERQIERETQKPCPVHAGARAESGNSAENRGAGVPALAHQLDNFLVEGLSLVQIPLADVYSHEHSLTLESMH